MSERWRYLSEKLSDPVFWYSVGVAVLLVTCILYSGALTTPYNTDGPWYEIVHESTDRFEGYVEDSEELQEMSSVPVNDLSPETQQAFDEMQSEYTRDGNEDISNGWQRTGPVPVCHPSLIYCDEYAESPDFPTQHIEDAGTNETYGLVEDDGDEYLVRMSYASVLNFGPLVIMGVKMLVLAPYAGFLLWSGFTREKGTNRAQTTYATVGLGLAGAVLAYPYLIMLAEYPTRMLDFGLLAFVSWGTIMAGIYLRLTSDSEAPR